MPVLRRKGSKPVARPRPAQEEQGGGLVKFDCRRHTFTHEGKLFGPGLVTLDTGTELGRRRLKDLTRSRERVEKSDEEYLKGLRQQGVLNSELPPSHEVYDPDQLPEGYELTPPPSRSRRGDSSAEE